MKVKEAIQQLGKMDQDAELVIEFDEFPGHFSPVLGFQKDKAGDAETSYMAKGTLEHYCKDSKVQNLSNIKTVVICLGQEP